MAEEKKEQQLPEENLFRILWPGMIQHTRLLIVDYDVLRYHSFDQLRWQLMMDTKTDQFEHFTSLREDLRPLLNGAIDWADQVQFAQQNIDKLNIYELFRKPLPDGAGTDRKSYERKLREMMAYTPQKITPTDLNDRLGVIFDRSDITGYLAQYKCDTNEPDFIESVTKLPVNHVLNVDVIAAMIWEYSINAVMMASSEMAIRVALKLVQLGYKSAITFMLGHYAYNYFRDQTTGKLHPLYNNEMGELEIALKHEFGFFEPFTGLAYKSYLEQQTKRYMEESKHAE